jgi:hypothetical protein
MIKTEHLSDSVTLYLGDCRDVLPTLARADALITDPPYGVNIGAHKALRDNRPHLLRKGGYESYDDTPENFDAIVVPALALALEKVERGAIFTAGHRRHLHASRDGTQCLGVYVFSCHSPIRDLPHLAPWRAQDGPAKQRSSRAERASGAKADRLDALADKSGQRPRSHGFGPLHGLRNDGRGLCRDGPEICRHRN